MNTAANSDATPAANAAGGSLPIPRPWMAWNIPWRTFLNGALLVVAVCIASWPALDGRFIWQDWHNILNNLLVTSKAGLTNLWYSPSQTHFAPLTKTFFWLEYHWFGPFPLGYHVVSLLLTSGLAILFWRFLLRLAIPGAFAAALLFAAHPLTLQTTAYISRTGSILATGFLLAGLWFWVDYLDAPQHQWRRIASLGFIVAALLCHPMLVAGAPLLLLLLTWWQGKPLNRHLWHDLIPVLIFMVLVVAATLWFSGPVAATTHLPLNQRLAISGWAFWFYLSKLLWPVNLTLIYKPWSMAAAGFWAYLPLVAAVVVFAGLVWLSAKRNRTGRAILMGLGFYLLALLPVIGLIKLPWMRYTTAANTLSYLAILGIMALVGTGWRLWHDRLKTGGRITLEALGLVVVLILLIVSNLSARLYQYPSLLWQSTLKTNPLAWPARNNLAQIAMRLRPARVFSARRQAQQAIAIDPNDLAARLLLSKVDFEVGDTKAGLAQLADILKRDPHNSHALSRMAMLALAQHQTTLALRYATAAVKAHPDRPQTNMAMGQVLMYMGHWRRAVKYLGKAVRSSPSYTAAHVALGALFLHTGKLAFAVREYRRAVKLDPENIPLRFAYARLLARIGLVDQANEEFHTLLARRPHSAELYQAYGLFLLRNEVYRRAAVQLRHALKINSHNAMAWMLLSVALQKQGLAAQARACVKQARKIDPNIMAHSPQPRPSPTSGPPHE